MNYIQGNMWNFHTAIAPVCITTNIMLNKKGELVMGAGVAKQAKLRFPDLPAYAGRAVKSYGDVTIFCPHPYDLFLFPTKYDWRNPSEPALIQNSAFGLRVLVDKLGYKNVYMTQPGCGNGGLNWNQVEPLLKPYLDDRFYIVAP